MKKTLLVTSALFIIIAAISFITNPAASHSNGAPAGYCNDPAGGNQTCQTGCHSSGPVATPLGTITSTIPGAGYTPGNTYTITASITRVGHLKFGFEVSPQNAGGTYLGTLITTNATETKLVGSTVKYITHTSSGTSGTDSRTWTFDWTAPVAGSGAVTFYGVFNVTNNGGNNSGDTIYTATLNASETFSCAINLSASQTNVSCFGGSNGSATISATGGTPAYTYSWSPSGGTSSSATGLSASTYTCTVTDVNGCTQTQTVTITQPTILSTSVSSQTNVSCNGGTNGSATISASGGTSAYTYLWSPSGGTSSTATGLSAGTFTCTITDSKGCTKTQTVSITQPAVLATSVSSQTNVSCNGGSNGSATISASGGTPAYTYSWSPSGGTSSTGTGLSSATFTCTVTDVNGCSKTQTVSITQPSAIVLNTNSTSATCGANNGSASVTASGGAGGYTYLWSPSGGTNASATGLSAGTYTITVTDATGCSNNKSVAVSNSGGPSATAGVNSNVSCYGGSNGSAFVNVSGGTLPYTYLWLPSGGTNSTATGLSAGNYSAQVTDQSGCVSISSVEILQPTEILVSLSSQINISCNGGTNGSAAISASGGTLSYTYAWSPGGGTSSTATGLSAGIFTCTITDAHGCTKTQSVNITQPTLLVADAGINFSFCAFDTIQIGGSPSAFGGTVPYTYSWSPSTGLNFSNVANPLSTLSADLTYTLTVTDNNGCTSSNATDVTVHPLPASPVITISNDTLYSSPATSYQWYLNGIILSGSTSSFYYDEPDELDPATQTQFAEQLPAPSILDASAGGTFTMSITQFKQDLGIRTDKHFLVVITDAHGCKSTSNQTSDTLLTTVWGYNGTFPGPTIMAKKNIATNFFWNNNLTDVDDNLLPHFLPVDSTVHWALADYPNWKSLGVPIVTHVHGSHSESASDGLPEQWYTPHFALKGKDFVKGDVLPFHYDNDQEAATLWYHDHALGITRLNVYAGLAGFYLLRDDNENALIASDKLPARPYEREIAIQDRMFLSNGQLYFPSEPEEAGDPDPCVHPEFFGNTILVNGKLWPVLEVEPREYRLRFLNGSDSRFYNLSFSNAMHFKQIGTDDGLLEAPVELSEMLMGPGERADVVMDFSDAALWGQTIILTNDARSPYPGGDIPNPLYEGKIMAIRINQPLNNSYPLTTLPATLRAPIIPLVQNAATRKLILFEGEDDYGRIMPMLGTATDGALLWDDSITENPMLNDIEQWEIYNLTSDAHPMHLHLVSFQIINRQPFNGDVDANGVLTNISLTGAAVNPEPREKGWKDTAPVHPGEVMRVIAKFDREGLYVWHCHILSHEDNEMMRPYYVGNMPTAIPSATVANENLFLEQNFPNPAFTTTKIFYHLPEASTVTLKLFNMVGQEIKTLVNKFQESGMHSADVNLSDVAPGIYSYTLSTGKYFVSRRMIVK